MIRLLEGDDHLFLPDTGMKSNRNRNKDTFAIMATFHNLVPAEKYYGICRFFDNNPLKTCEFST